MVGGGCEWLMVVGGGCEWLVVVVSGWLWLRVVGGGCEWLVVVASSWLWLQGVVAVESCLMMRDGSSLNYGSWINSIPIQNFV